MGPQNDPEQIAASAGEPTLEFRVEQKPGLGAGCLRCGAPPKGTLLLCAECIAEDERAARLRQPRWTPGNLAALKSLALAVISCAFLVGFWPAAILVPVAFILATDTLIRGKGLSVVGVFLAVLAIVPGFLLCGSILRSMHNDTVEADNRRSCANNLKRIAQAIDAYAQDHDQRFPPIGDGSIGKPSPRSWESLIRPHIDTRADKHPQDVWHCPDDRQGRQSYAANGFVSGKPAVGVFGYPCSAISDWSETFLLVENFRENASPPGPRGGISGTSRGRNDWTPGAHDSGTDSLYAYCDGRVESARAKDVPNATDKHCPWAADAAVDQ